MKTSILLSALMVTLLHTALTTDAWALGSEEGEFGKKFGIDLRYENILALDHSTQSFPNASPNNITGKFTGQRGLVGLIFRPTPGTHITFFGGMMLLGQLNATANVAVGGVSNEALGFDTSSSFGIALRSDVLPTSSFHIVPSFRWLRSDLLGIAGAVTNSTGPCSAGYDYGNNAASNCVTVGNGTGGGVLRSAFTQHELVARIEMGYDIIGEPAAPILNITAGVEEAVSLMAGTITYSPPSAASFTENYNLASTRKDGLYASLTTQLGLASLQIYARAVDQTSLGGSLRFNF